MMQALENIQKLAATKQDNVLLEYPFYYIEKKRTLVL